MDHVHIVNTIETISGLETVANEAIRVADRQQLNSVVKHSESLLPTVASDERQRLEGLILHWQAFALYYGSHFDQALHLFEQARVIFETMQSSQDVARAIKSIGACYQQMGNLRDAVECMQLSRSLYREVADHIGEATALGNIANLMLLEGKYEDALRSYEEALAVHEQEQDRDGVARTIGNIAGLLKETGRPEEALRYFNEALRVYQELKDSSGTGRISGNIGATYYSIGDYAEALEWYYRALSIHEELGDRQRVARMKSNIAGVYSDTGDPSTALKLYTEALHQLEEIKDTIGAAHITGLIGMTYHDLLDTENALSYLERGCALCRETGTRRSEAYYLSALASLYLSLGRVEEATTTCATAMDRAQDLPAVVAQLTLLEANLAAIGGDIEQAQTLCLRSRDLARLHHQRQTEMSVLRSLRDLYRNTGPLSLYVEYDDAYEALSDDIRSELQQRRLAVATAERRISEERRRSERQRMLLYNALPSHIADRLLEEESSLAEVHHHAAVLFLDIVDFTKHAQKHDPLALIQFLNEIFTVCDEICSHHGMMKIKTIGDAYMAVAFDDAVNVSANVARQMQQIRISWPSASGQHVDFRIGLHVGTVIAGVIGTERLQYDVWGDTVNVASRLEGTSMPGQIHISEEFANALSTSSDAASWALEQRGSVEIKGKGRLTTYWLHYNG